jgi:hypothetical protein
MELRREPPGWPPVASAVLEEPEGGCEEAEPHEGEGERLRGRGW